MKKQALAGVNVLDFGWAVVGGLSGKYLGDHGAQVVRVESTTRPDLVRATQYVSISRADSLARSVMDRLIYWADVVLENYTPGTMSRMGYGYEYMRKIKQDIIMVSGS